MWAGCAATHPLHECPTGDQGEHRHGDDHDDRPQYPPDAGQPGEDDAKLVDLPHRGMQPEHDRPRERHGRQNKDCSDDQGSAARLGRV